jgi:FtsH-binding integral membrane protein
MSEIVKKMKPIWYFVGLALLVMGVVILATGVYDLVNHIESKKVLARLHPAVWWGAIMTVFGLVFVLANRKSSVD